MLLAVEVLFRRKEGNQSATDLPQNRRSIAHVPVGLTESTQHGTTYKTTLSVKVALNSANAGTPK